MGGSSEMVGLLRRCDESFSWVKNPSRTFQGFLRSCIMGEFIRPTIDVFGPLSTVECPTTHGFRWRLGRLMGVFGGSSQPRQRARRYVGEATEASINAALWFVPAVFHSYIHNNCMYERHVGFNAKSSQGYAHE